MPVLFEKVADVGLDVSGEVNLNITTVDVDKNIIQDVLVF